MSLAGFSRETLGYGAGTVLEEVSLTLSPGERLVLLGRSGAGKTTLLNAFHDRLVAGGHRVALAPQDHALVPQLTVLRNVLMGRLDDHGAAYNLTNLIRPRRADREAVEALLGELGLSGQIDQPVEALSGGQRQRTALARALYRGGAVLVADEPVSAVDGGQAVALMDLMQARFSTAVVALHDVALARRFATRLVGIRHGRIVMEGAPAALAPGTLDALYSA